MFNASVLYIWTYPIHAHTIVNHTKINKLVKRWSRTRFKFSINIRFRQIYKIKWQNRIFERPPYTWSPTHHTEARVWDFNTDSTKTCYAQASKIITLKRELKRFAVCTDIRKMSDFTLVKLAKMSSPLYKSRSFIIHNDKIIMTYHESPFHQAQRSLCACLLMGLKIVKQLWW